jgi:RimJ/RimL family protein N-acetyltransferase
MAGTQLPLTRIAASADEIARLKAVVRTTERIPQRFGEVRVARHSDAPALARLLDHETIGPRIYTMPRRITADTMRSFIEAHLDEQARGEGVLFGVFDATGEALAYFDVELWAEWGACKFGGAVKASRQGRGFGGTATIAAVEWCFGPLGVQRIGETTALDNDRSIRLLSRLGFQPMGEITSVRPDGGVRASLYWELERTAWTASYRRAG